MNRLQHAPEVMAATTADGEIVMMEGESGYRVALGRSLAEREPLIE